MTASRLGLAILTALALALGLVVVLDTRGAPPTATRRLLPALDPDAVASVTIARGDEAPVVLARAGHTWRVANVAPGPADERVVADVLGALELASAERWVASPPPEVALAAPRLVVTVEALDGSSTRLAIGAEVGELVWMRAGEGRSALVARWVARALDRGVADLRRRDVVGVPRPTAIELHAGGVDLVVSGPPLRAHLPSGAARLAPARAAALVDALAALRFTGFPREAPPADRVGSLRVLGGDAPVEIDDLGACPGDPARRWLGGTPGAGCVEPAAWDAVLAAARAIVDDPAGAVDPRPLGPGPVARVVLADGAALEPRGGAWTLDTGGEVDDAAVRELLAALAAPGRVTAGAVTAGLALAITHEDGAVDDLVVDARNARLTRRGEPWTIAIDPSLARRLARGARAVVDRTLLAEDPYLLRRIDVTERGRTTTVAMGAHLEDWPGADVDAVLAVRDLAAALVADELLDAPPRSIARTLRLHYDAPPAAGASPSTHEIALAADCRAVVDGTPARLPPDACATLRARLR